MAQNIIEVRNLSKSFDIASKEPGLKRNNKTFFQKTDKKFKSYKRY